MADALLQGGTVVDGRGTPAYRADVRVRDGRIAEVGPDLRPDGERVIDATDAYVTPGIIEPHCHVDGAMWWDPSLDPLPSYGVTSAVFGNCGVSMAPSAGGQREDLVALFCFLEDLPKVAFDRHVPWAWETWPEYWDAARGHATSVNTAGYLGHLSLRTYVMGPEAWERAATPAEVQRMTALADAALDAGALGLSTNLFDRDRIQRPVPTCLADDEELGALLDVVGRRRGATLQVITRFDDPDPAHFRADIERFARLAAPRGVRGQWTVIPSGTDEADRRIEATQIHRQLRDSGLDFWGIVPHMGSSLFYTFERSLAFLRFGAWHEMINGPAEDKLRSLQDPQWLARARYDWDHRRGSTSSRLEHPDRLYLSLSANGSGPTDITLTDFAAQEGLHLSDALAKWLVANGIGSALRALPEPYDEDAVAEGIRDPHILTNINDCGAHLQLFCGAGQNMSLLTHYVRDRGLLSVEDAVHVLTGRVADFFGLAGRGVVAPGAVADLNVFALDEIEMRPEIRAYDVPDGSWRFSRPPAGFRATMVAGVPTFIDGRATGALPGGALEPSPG